MWSIDGRYVWCGVLAMKAEIQGIYPRWTCIRTYGFALSRGV